MNAKYTKKEFMENIKNLTSPFEEKQNSPFDKVKGAIEGIIQRIGGNGSKEIK